MTRLLDELRAACPDLPLSPPNADVAALWWGIRTTPDEVLENEPGVELRTETRRVVIQRIRDELRALVVRPGGPAAGELSVVANLEAAIALLRG